MKPTPYDDVNTTLASLLPQMQAVLRERLVGLYLYGSLATGGYIAGCSDIDLLAAVSSDVGNREFDGLQLMHARFTEAHPEWDDRIEVQYVPLVALRTFKTHSRTVPVVSPGEPFHWREIDRAWTMNWYDVQENGVTLAGPDPRTLIDPISQAELVASLREQGEEWRERMSLIPRRRGSLAYAILTMCRTLHTCDTGRQISKHDAARRAQEALPAWAPVIQLALEWRLDVDHHAQPADEAAFQTTSTFVHFVADRVLGQ